MVREDAGERRVLQAGPPYNIASELREVTVAGAVVLWAWSSSSST